MLRTLRHHARRVIVAVALAAPLSGCGEAEDVAQEALAKLRTLRDKACACAAPTCAADLAAEQQAFQRWVEDHRAKLSAERTEAFEREWSSLSREVAACTAANAAARGN
ncbi:MAG: hypothetical protein KBG48_11355 [Kofleriaceae bacterium]|nr:hypothetical protein [Kofleriaceae bacterium]MBP9167981.1 hypothetical protein [Kofleriaceae bacterium]MBP9856815.1 hypothetical protein [Kofleriaceae bacterium]